MKETYRILPVYAGDVSGIASALYELGGMTVIHDPSGCNSTYNTHDELRWYEKPSAVFISGLTMRDAVLGNDRKFIRDILEAANTLPRRPEFIALCNSPLPWLNGTDFQAIARMVERESGIPSFYVPSNGCRDYAVGAGKAFDALLRKFEDRLRGAACSPHHGINLIGMTPLDFGNPACFPDLIERMRRNGFEVKSVFAMTEGDGLGLFKQILTSSQADASLVLTFSGLPAAQYLKDTFGVPFVVGVPLEEEHDPVLTELCRAAEGKPYRVAPCTEDKPETRAGVPGVCLRHSDVTEGTGPFVIGEPVLSQSLADLIRRKTGKNATVICPLEMVPAPAFRILREDDHLLYGEEAIEEAFSGMNGVEVYCDPLYAGILPAGTKIHPMPTLALSGRRFRHQFINYFSTDKIKEMIGDEHE